jgi:hypothetical protein
MGETNIDTGFSAGDFRLLEEMAFAGTSVAPRSEARIEALWAKAARLVDGLGKKLFPSERFTVAIWPDSAQNERLPFIWARLKRDVGARYATHIGVFLAPDQCNLCIDLEKDLLDAGVAAEHLDQVLDFYRCRLAESMGSLGRSDMKVWTDPHNVVSAGEFPGLDLDCFMDANTDSGHPWPRIGYRFDATEVQAFAEGWVQETTLRAMPLVPIYDAMIAAYRGGPEPF